MYLFINTSNSQKIILALISQGGKILSVKNIKAPYQQSEKLLSAIEKIVSNVNVKISNLSKLKGILVATGPGGFTSLRIGLATANALAWVLQIPIVGIELDNKSDKELIEQGYKKIKKLKKFKQVLPNYGKQPNVRVSFS